MFSAGMMFVLAWPLLVDTLFTIATLGHWSPRLYSKAFHSEWLEQWFIAVAKHSEPAGAEGRNAE